MLSAKFSEAMVFACQLHQNQTRKGTTIPYISHLLAVCCLVIENGGTEDQAIAGLLHDAAEDQGGKPTLDEIELRFGSAVAQIVADCTDAWVEPKPPWRERKEAYIRALPQKPLSSLLVSLADKTQNARAILFDYRQLGNDLWPRFTGGRDGTIWYYRSLVSVFEKLMPGQLSQELARSVAEFARIGKASGGTRKWSGSMRARVELNGAFRIANDYGLRARRARLDAIDDPRKQFYDAMLVAKRYEEYEARVGAIRVMPKTRLDGPFSGHQEIVYARKRGWIADV